MTHDTSYSDVTSSVQHLFNELDHNAVAVAPPLAQACHFRSQLFNTQAGINPLITAATPLLTLLERIQTCPDLINQTMGNDIAHEFKAFEARATAFNYPLETIILTKHLLLDVYFEWLPHNDFRQWLASNNQHTKSYFFTVLKRLQKDARHHLDILELMYLCLSMGYQGEYKQSSTSTLNAIINDLYVMIQNIRGDEDPILLINFDSAQVKPKQISYKPVGWLVTCAFSFFILSYIGLSYLEDLVSTPLQNQVNIVQQQIIQSILKS